MRNYAYGARPPIENAALVEEQFRLAHAYQCALIAIERRRRAVVDRLYQRACPAEWSAREATGNAAREAAEQVRFARSTDGEKLDGEARQARKRGVEAASEALKQARAAERDALKAWWDARKAALPKLRRRLKMVDRGAYFRSKRAYNLAGTVGLAWGTRLKIGESVERAAKAALQEESLPRFPRFTGVSAMAVQIQGGMSAADALGAEDTRFRLQVVNREEWLVAQGLSATTSSRKDGRTYALPQPKADGKRTKKRVFALARLRAGSDGRAPVWMSCPVSMRRPVPADAPIKWAQFCARKIGPRIERRLIVTIDDSDALEKVASNRPSGPTLAVNLGWRMLPDAGLRVAYAVGSDGWQEEVRVPARYIEGVAHVASLQSIRDRQLEELKKSLRAWLDGEGREHPEWLASEVAHLENWKSAKRAAWLLNRWRTRFPGDEKTFAALGAWVKEDRHLWFWVSDEREKLLRMRKDSYRCAAKRWAKKYARIIVTDMDLRDFAELPAPEEASKSEGAEARRSRTLAAPSVLRDAIKNACSTTGAVFEENEAAYLTQTCNACGLVLAPKKNQHGIVRICECGSRWDQDANHCRNLLASAQVARDAGEPLAEPSATEEKGKDSKKGRREGRWKRRRSQGTA